MNDLSQVPATAAPPIPTPVEKSADAVGWPSRTPRQRLTRLVWLLIPCLVSDQVTKLMAIIYLKDQASHSFWGNTFRLQYAENTGAFLGFGANLPEPWRFIALNLAASAVLLLLATFIVFKRDITSREFYGYGLIVAGGLGNMIDRFYAGAVVDFMNMGIGGLRTGIFNVADMIIMAGLGFVLVDHLRLQWQHWQQQKALKMAPQGVDKNLSGVGEIHVVEDKADAAHSESVAVAADPNTSPKEP